MQAHYARWCSCVRNGDTLNTVDLRFESHEPATHHLFDHLRNEGFRYSAGCVRRQTWSRFCRATLRPGLLLIAAYAARQTAHQETVRRSYCLSLNPPIEPIHHFLLSRERKLVGAVKNKSVEPLRLADGLI